MSEAAGRTSEEQVAPEGAAEASPAPDDPRVTRVVEEYLAALEAGQPPDRHEFLARYAEIAGELGRCLEGLDFIQAAAPQVRESGEEDAALSAPGVEPEAPLGDYRIVREIGRGGMGVVYEAVQLSLGRRVALKVLPFAAALDSRQLQRFKNEAQAAAHLHYQNIVPVYGVGCERGVHYYAMQFIDGQTLAALIRELRQQMGLEAAGEVGKAGEVISGRREVPDRADSQPTEAYSPLTPRPATPPANTLPPGATSAERSATSPGFFRTAARLGVQAAEALEHAHSMGVVHRDVKPANLMVDERGNVWVADFGLAFSQGQPGLTMTGDLVGTLRYMSPEQALGQRGVVDHRTDVYSLGATLYELLTLEPAFGGADRQELLRQIAFDEPKPLRRYNRAVPAELETIVLKALEKSPAERYATAQELADDLARFLRDEPIRARRPTLAQRVRKWARRNRPLVWSLALSFSTLLVLAVIGLVISNARISREKGNKERALEEAEANLLLARQAVDEMYMRVADEVSLLPHMQPYQRALLQKALRFYEEFAQRKGSDPLIRLGRAEASLRVVQIQYTLGQRGQVEPTGRAAVAELEGLAGELPGEARVPLLLGEAHTFLGSILAQAGRRLEAEKNQRQAVALYEQLVFGSPDKPEYRYRVAASYGTLGGLLHHQPREAEKCHRDAIALCDELAAGWPGEPLYRGQLTNSHYTLGLMLARTGQPRQAEQALRHAIELYDKDGGALDRTGFRLTRAAAEYELGMLLAAGGQVDKAEKAYREAIARVERLVVLFPDLPDYRQTLAVYCLGLVQILTQKERPDEAEAPRRLAHDVIEKLLAEVPDVMGGPVQSVQWLHSLGLTQRDLRDLRGAEQTLRRALTLAGQLAEKSAEPTERRLLADIHGDLGVVLQKARRPREAAEEFRQHLAIWERLTAEFPGEPEYRYRQARAQNFLGIALRTLPGETEAAARNHRQSLALCDRLVAEFPDVPEYQAEVFRSHYALATALMIAGRCTEAEQSYQQALAAYRPPMSGSRKHDYSAGLASVHNDLAWLRATRPDGRHRDPAGAVESARKAVELDPKKRAYWNTLGAAHYRAGHGKEALAAFQKSTELGKGGDSFDWFFLAMVHWQLGDREAARKVYRQAVGWMDQHQPGNDELRRFREEAATLLGVPDPKK
jgi:serine/threonine protein kinase/Flp pilus assembly protein TadD